MELTILMARLYFIQLPYNSMLFAIDDTIGHTHVIWIDLKTNTFYLLTELKKITVMMTPACHRVVSTFEHGGLLTIFFNNIVAVKILDLILLEYPPVTPLKSS